MSCVTAAAAVQQPFWLNKKTPFSSSSDVLLFSTSNSSSIVASASLLHCPSPRPSFFLGRRLMIVGDGGSNSTTTITRSGFGFGFIPRNRRIGSSSSFRCFSGKQTLTYLPISFLFFLVSFCRDSSLPN